ncbi:hypothetical protein ACFQY5_06780 [Paeniroseomonas aquatica]|uniref:hypothetical protein n=1 Tax=Paeniroseomonas aquatica TaxID=373043 RepID=UPI003613AF3C
MSLPRPAGQPAAALALGLGAALLLWPALLNGYPLVFSDTGAFLAQTVEGWAIWDKPFVYGPALHAFHGRLTLWGPALAQGLLLSWLAWLAQRGFLGGARPGRHLALCAGLAAGSAAPWFTAQLMPDILAPALVLALALLGFAADRLSRAEALGLQGVAALAAAAHLSHLPLAAALVLLVLAATRRARPALRCAAPLGAAVALLLAGNLATQGRLAVSPYGAVFALARLVADGPAARTIAARCPDAGWQLCRWAGRLPTDSDLFLWSGDGPVWSPGPMGSCPAARSASPRKPAPSSPRRCGGAAGGAAGRARQRLGAAAPRPGRRCAGAGEPGSLGRAAAGAGLPRRRAGPLRRRAAGARPAAVGGGACPGAAAAAAAARRRRHAAGLLAGGATWRCTDAGPAAGGAGRGHGECAGDRRALGPARPLPGPHRLAAAAGRAAGPRFAAQRSGPPAAGLGGRMELPSTPPMPPWSSAPSSSPASSRASPASACRPSPSASWRWRGRCRRRWR